MGMNFEVQNSFSFCYFKCIMKTKLITLLLEAVKDPTQYTSYHPIPLFNIDAKILTSTLVRLQKALPVLIHITQSERCQASDYVRFWLR